jgi:hypothetical protein
MKEKKKKTFDLVSSNEEVNSVLNNMKSNSKVYLKLITGLQLLGNFEGKTEIDFYDKIDDDKEKKIRLWCTDSEDNLFVFYGYSSDRTDLLKITKETNEETLEYDLTLAKKFTLNSNNINFTRSNQIYGFKFGRLITDSNNFYSLFLRDDIGYQIQGNLNTNIVKELLSELNKLENLPKLTDYINIFERILSVKAQSGDKLAQFYVDYQEQKSLEEEQQKSNTEILEKLKNEIVSLTTQRDKLDEKIRQLTEQVHKLEGGNISNGRK